VSKDDVIRNRRKHQQTEMEGRQMMGSEIGSQEFSTQFESFCPPDAEASSADKDTQFAPG
jgi:hypothetical protein